jgi:hypothetical protein
MALLGAGIQRQTSPSSGILNYNRPKLPACNNSSQRLNPTSPLTNSLTHRPTHFWFIKLLLAFASIVIPGLSNIEINDRVFYFLLDMYVLRNGIPSSTREGKVFLCRRYVSCSLVSARVYQCCHSVQVIMDPLHPLSLHYTRDFL